MNNENPDWKRILAILDYSGEPNISALARALGMRRSATLFQLKRKGAHICYNLAVRIKQVYPALNLNWILNGTPPQYVSTPIEQDLLVNPLCVRRIPFYFNLKQDADGTCSSNLYLYISTSIAPEAQYVTFYQDTLLTPRLNSGSYLFLYKCNPSELIIYGNIYLICTDHFEIYRIVRKGKNDEQIRLTTAQPNNHNEIICNRTDIRALYLVCTAISSTV